MTNFIRPIVNFFVLVFVIITLLIAVLLVIYYSTPNNYIIYKFDKTKFNPENKQIEYIVEPGSNIKIKSSDYMGLKIRFSTDTNLLIKNIFKSQNIFVNSNDLVDIMYNSDVIIINDTDLEKKLILNLYNKK